MNLSVEFTNSESIVCDNETFRAPKSTRNLNSISYQCSHSKCLAKITLNKDKNKILAANFVHNHIQSKVPFSKSSTSSKNKSISNSDKTKPNNIIKKNLDKSKLESTNPKTSATSCNNNSQSKLTLRNQNTSDSIDNNQSITSSVPTMLENKDINVTSKTKCSSTLLNRVHIFSDSMGRKINELISQYNDLSLNVFSMIKPNATFSQVIESIPALCSDFNTSDAIIIIAGSNDFSRWLPNTCKKFDLSPLKCLIGKTNVIINSVPARFDSAHSKAAIGIYNSNFGLQHSVIKYGFLYFDSFSLLKRPYFTKHGLHLNKSGKRIFAVKLKTFILNHIVDDTLKKKVSSNLSTQPQLLSSFSPIISAGSSSSSSSTFSHSPAVNLENQSFQVSPTDCSSPLAPQDSNSNTTVYLTPSANPIPTILSTARDIDSPSYFLRRKRNTRTT